MKYGKGYLLPILLFSVVTGSLLGGGCRKENDPQNNTVIRTPYGVYFSDRLGALYNTNDGKAFKSVFPTDGYSPRSIIATSGDNILWIKKNLHVSADNGENFNPASLKLKYLMPDSLSNWMNLILDVPSFGRVYVATPNSAKGIAISKDHGITWEDDGAASVVTSGVQSFAQLTNGKLYALDNTSSTVYEQVSAPSPWTAVAPVTPLPAGRFHMTRFNNNLVAADYNGAGGVYYSNNGGVDWFSYPGMPTNQEIYAISAPFDQVLLAGTDSAGVYRLNGTSFEPSNNGLQPFTKVYGFAGKQDTYKNDRIIQYIYIATNNGIFRSEDLGRNWVLVRPGDFRAIY
jgi:hypothetical protein